MITYDEARRLISTIAHPLGTERVGLAEARGRTLAAAVVAGRPAPPAAVSAMDGYAVRDADLAVLPACLPIAGESFAGAGHLGALPSGACIRIFTGAPVPGGADRVIMQEDVVREAGVALFALPPGARRHVRAAGSDFAAGEVLVPRGWSLNPQRLLTAAAADLASVEVYRRPRVAILATGDELVAPGAQALRPEAIPESVSFGVAALAQDWGADVTWRRRCGDDLEKLTQAAADAAQSADVVVVTGGASVGEKDFARAMFEPLGLELIFAKVAIKPGKPIWLGRAGGAIVVGLPGNPTSAMVTARLFLAPLLVGLGGRDPVEAWTWLKAPLLEALPACGERETFLRACRTPDGIAVMGDQDSAAQFALAASDALVRRRPGSEPAKAAEPVEYIPL